MLRPGENEITVVAGDRKNRITDTYRCFLGQGVTASAV